MITKQRFRAGGNKYVVSVEVEGGRVDESVCGGDRPLWLARFSPAQLGPSGRDIEALRRYARRLGESIARQRQLGELDWLHEAECQCCDWKGGEEELGTIKHFWERVEPGEVVPAGECPACGALAHRVEG